MDLLAFEAWYRENRSRFEELCEVVVGLLRTLLVQNKIPYASLAGRAKGVESAIKKVKNKTYSDPARQVTDFAGIRAITFIEDEVSAAESVIRNSFRVHSEHSLNKADSLGSDRTGYRSVHLVCDLGETRLALPEYARFQSMRFEVQIRTLLQHAWAEIQHDRGYKLSANLPVALTRRLNLVAGVLEIADREFNSIAQEVDSYTEEAKIRAVRGELDEEINGPTLVAYLSSKVRGLPAHAYIPTNDPTFVSVVISELRKFGIERTTDLDALFSREFMDAVGEHEERANEVGLLRDAMMYADLRRYFDVAFDESWSEADSATLRLLSDKFGEEVVKATFEVRGIWMPVEEDPLELGLD